MNARWNALAIRATQRANPLLCTAGSRAGIERTLALPEAARHWSLTTLQTKLIKIGAKVVRHARYVTFQMAAVAVPRTFFRAILGRIHWLWSPPLWVPG